MACHRPCSKARRRSSMRAWPRPGLSWSRTLRVFSSRRRRCRRWSATRSELGCAAPASRPSAPPEILDLPIDKGHLFRLCFLAGVFLRLVLGGCASHFADALDDLLTQFKPDRPPGLLCRTVARSAVYPHAATSSTRMATTSQPRSLLSIARLNMARSRVRPSIWSFVRIDQTCLGRSGASPRSACPCSRACGLDFSTGRLRCLTWSYSSVTEDDHHARPVVCFPVFPVADFEGGATHPSPLARRRRSGSHAKNDVHDAFDFTETLRVEVEGDFDVFVVLPGDLEGEACGCELNEPQAVVAGVGIVIEGLDVADAAIIILELTLNEKIGLIGWRRIQVIVAGVLVIERDLEVLAAGLSDGHMFGVESHWRWPCFSALPSSVS